MCSNVKRCDAICRFKPNGKAVVLKTTSSRVTGVRVQIPEAALADIGLQLNFVIHIAMHTEHPGEERCQRAGADYGSCNPKTIAFGESVRDMATYLVKGRNNKFQNRSLV